MVGFGITSILYKLASKHIDSVSLVLLVYLFATILTAIVWFFMSEKTITTEGVIYAGISAMTATISFIAFVTALSKGKAAIVAPIRNLSLVVTVVLALLFLSERLSITKAIGVVFAVCAVVLLSI